jgi:hypothetical protein
MVGDALMLHVQVHKSELSHGLMGAYIFKEILQKVQFCLRKKDTF